MGQHDSEPAPAWVKARVAAVPGALPSGQAATSTATVQPHRADIEGLRGVAVLSVFAVHAVPGALRGGFVGVDVFFVLSGYLIASITLREQDAGHFSVASFYARRLRRLLPALLVVLTACLVFAAWFAFPNDSKAIGKHVVGGATFVSNLVLWREAGYFDVASQTKPLLHLWSLGIEEQFYLFWPLLAFLIVRSGPRALALVGMLTLLSFALNVALVFDKPKGTFFLPPTRFWELLVGVLLACWARRARGDPVAQLRKYLRPGSRLHAALPDMMAGTGVLLLLSALLLIDETDHFPGWWALLPTLATALLLTAGMQAWVNRRVLSDPVLRFYGRISYPLYLWHWPLLTFPLLLDYQLGVWEQIALQCGAVLLATLTYYFIEAPFRFGRLAKPAPALLMPALAVACGFGSLLYMSDGLVEAYPERVRAIAHAAVLDDYADYRVERCFLRTEQKAQAFAPECVERAGASRPLFMLWGDSHAAALFPGVQALLAEQPAALRLAQFTAAQCPPSVLVSQRHGPHCAGVNAHVLEQVRRERPAVVVLGAYWGRYQGIEDLADAEIDGLRDTVARLRELGVARVVVVGPLTEWRLPLPRLLLAEWASSGMVAERGADGFVELAQIMDTRARATARAAGAEYVSPVGTLCNALGCERVVERSGVLHAMAFDQTHLTTVGSQRLAQALRQALLNAPATAPGSPP